MLSMIPTPCNSLLLLIYDAIYDTHTIQLLASTYLWCYLWYPHHATPCIYLSMMLSMIPTPCNSLHLLIYDAIYDTQTMQLLASTYLWCYLCYPQHTTLKFVAIYLSMMLSMIPTPHNSLHLLIYEAINDTQTMQLLASTYLWWYLWYPHHATPCIYLSMMLSMIPKPCNSLHLLIYDGIYDTNTIQLLASTYLWWYLWYPNHATPCIYLSMMLSMIPTPCNSLHLLIYDGIYDTHTMQLLASTYLWWYLWYPNHANPCIYLSMMVSMIPTPCNSLHLLIYDGIYDTNTMQLLASTYLWCYLWYPNHANPCIYLSMMVSMIPTPCNSLHLLIYDGIYDTNTMQLLASTYLWCYLWYPHHATPCIYLSMMVSMIPTPCNSLHLLIYEAIYDTHTMQLLASTYLRCYLWYPHHATPCIYLSMMLSMIPTPCNSLHLLIYDAIYDTHTMQLLASTYLWWYLWYQHHATPCIYLSMMLSMIPKPCKSLHLLIYDGIYDTHTMQLLASTYLWWYLWYPHHATPCIYLSMMLSMIPTPCNSLHLLIYDAIYDTHTMQLLASTYLWCYLWYPHHATPCIYLSMMVSMIPTPCNSLHLLIYDAIYDTQTMQILASTYLWWYLWYPHHATPCIYLSMMVSMIPTPCNSLPLLIYDGIYDTHSIYSSMQPSYGSVTKSCWWRYAGRGLINKGVLGLIFICF